MKARKDRFDIRLQGPILAKARSPIRRLWVQSPADGPAAAAISGCVRGSRAAAACSPPPPPTRPQTDRQAPGLRSAWSFRGHLSRGPAWSHHFWSRRGGWLVHRRASRRGSWRPQRAGAGGEEETGLIAALPLSHFCWHCRGRFRWRATPRPRVAVATARAGRGHLRAPLSSLQPGVALEEAEPRHGHQWSSWLQPHRRSRSRHQRGGLKAC